jgi:hypothetical protein
MLDSYSERRELFSTTLFQEQVADRLQLDGRLVAPAIQAMVEADMLPCRLSRDEKALAVDGSLILAAIGGRQSRPTSTVRVGSTLCSMTLRNETGSPKSQGRADIFPTNNSVSFGTDVAEVFLNLWGAVRGSSTKGFKGVAIGVYWSDERGSLLSGTIEQASAGRKRTYATQALPAPPGGGKWDFVQLPTIGGTLFSPMSILRFGALLDASVEETAARL